MRDEDERDPELRLQRLQLHLQVLAEPGVESPERLVEKQHAGREDERPGQGDALLLPAGELARLSLREVAELDERERFGHPAPMLVLRQPLVLEAEADVPGHVEMGEERVALEHRVDVALVGRHLRHVDVVEHDPPTRRALEAGDHPQGRRLPAPRRPDHREELSAGHVEVDFVDRRDLAELLRQLLEMDLSLHQTSRPAMAAASSLLANRR